MAAPGGVIVNVHLREMGTSVPKLAADAIRNILAQGLAYLQEDMTRDPSNTRQPFDTGTMRLMTTTRVVNQYIGEIESPVDYTAPQEYGFFNVWAKRWLPGRHFMADAERYMDSIAEDVVARWLEEQL